MKLLVKLFTFLSLILLPSLSHADFKLCEFAGSYLGSSSSAGGNTIEDSQTAATTSVVQFDLDKHGKGRVNFLSAVVFFDVDLVVRQKFTPADNLPVEINLTFPSIGAGELTIFNYPRPKSVLKADFVAKKDRSEGRVTELFLTITEISGGTPPGVLRSPSNIKVERQ